MNRGGTRYDWLTRIALDAVWRIDSDRGPGLGWAWEDGRERKQGDQEAGWLVQARGDGGHEQCGHCGDGKKWSDSHYTLKVQMT